MIISQDPIGTSRYPRNLLPKAAKMLCEGLELALEGRKESDRESRTEKLQQRLYSLREFMEGRPENRRTMSGKD